MIPINRSYVITPSLGLGYIASVLRSCGHEIEILHCNKEKFSFNDFEDYIQRKTFDFIGIQMFTFDFNSVKRHLAIIKKHKPSTMTILGGYHPSGDPVEILTMLPQADFAFISEVEIAFPSFLEEMKKIAPVLSSVPNLVWRDGEKSVVNAPKLVDDLDEIPFPAWDLMDPRTYPEAPHGGFFKSFPTAPIVITRGCPMECTFCAGKSITSKKIRKRSAANVIEEIKLLKEKYGVNDFLIEDENFTLHKSLVHEFCGQLISQQLKITWSCPSGVRLDTLDLDTLKMMERSGCHSLAVGVEFGSQRIHDLTKKNLTLETIKERVALFQHVKIKVTGFFMFGIPGETEQEMVQTIQFAKSLNLDRAQFNNFMPLPGSALYTQLKSEGMRSIDYDHFFVHAVSYAPQGMTRKQVKNIQRRAYLEFYLRPKIMWGLLREITSWKHLWRLVIRFIDGLT